MMRGSAIAWALAGVSVATLAGSSYTLFRRIDAYNREHPRSMHYFQSIAATEFLYNDTPVTIVESRDADGNGDISFRFGDESLVLEIAIPPRFEQLNLETLGLAAHEDWLHVLRVIEGEPGKDFNTVLGEVEAAQRTDRLVIVTRTPRPGDFEGMLEKQGVINPDIDNDDWGYGEVMRKHWFFDFYEFMPDGTFKQHETLRFPSSKYMDGFNPGELRQGTWQYTAALYVIPKGSAPKYNFTEAALVHAGKSLAVAGVSVLVLMGSVAFALAPTREDRVPGTPASADQIDRAAERRG